MERIYPLIDKLLDYYPYFTSMCSSTNFSYDEWLDKLLNLLAIFGKRPERDFTFHLQLSVDGPEYINDANRGEGVTKKCIANFDRLIAAAKEGKIPPNVTLDMTIKGTWDADCIEKLNSKEKLIEFFQFYENNYHDKVYQLNLPNVHIYNSVPNTAVPAPSTKHDGQVFAKLVKKCREIEEENFTEHYFKYYTSITPFNDSPCEKCTSYTCG